jgi:hypothetical protein
VAKEDMVKLRWGVRRRLEFIDFRLFWDGEFNRSDLANTFGISTQQASSDIGQYEILAPRNIMYDRGKKSYLRTSQFSPEFLGEIAEMYLLDLVAIHSNWMKKEDSWFDTAPPVEIVSLTRKATSSDILLLILDAIRSRQQVTVEYSSLTGSSKEKRVIAPHALAHCAGRWYVRAWSAEHNDFRDYNLYRIRSIGGLKACNIDPSLDFEWVHKIDLIIIPNPGLPAEQRAAVAAEYEMSDGKLRFSTRLSLSFYLMTMYNMDVDQNALRPEKQQLILENRNEVMEAKTAARNLSKLELGKVRG